jgi:CO dehydrogenase nickel-insertion accessory protein CooC1
VVTAQRVAELRNALDINIEHLYLVMNRVQGELSPALQEAIAKLDIPLGALIPSDPQVMALDADGRPLVELNEDAPSRRAVAALAEQVLGEAIVK